MPDANDHTWFLRDFIETNCLHVIAEVGVYRGSLCRLLMTGPCVRMIREYWAVDKWSVPDMPQEMFREKEGDPEWWQNNYVKLLRFMMYYPQVRVARLESCEAARKLFPDEYFDLVYIDSNHLFDHVVRDLGCWCFIR